MKDILIHHNYTILYKNLCHMPYKNSFIIGNFDEGYTVIELKNLSASKSAFKPLSVMLINIPSLVN